MSILESLITNRTAADVARWRALRDKGFDAMSADEKAEWLLQKKESRSVLWMSL